MVRDIYSHQNIIENFRPYKKIVTKRKILIKSVKRMRRKDRLQIEQAKTFCDTVRKTLTTKALTFRETPHN